MVKLFNVNAEKYYVNGPITRALERNGASSRKSCYIKVLRPSLVQEKFTWESGGPWFLR